MNKEYEYEIKDEILCGEAGLEWEEAACKEIDMKNFFSEDYINHIMNLKEEGAFILVRTDFVEKFDIIKMFEKSTIGKRELDFIQFMIEIGVQDISGLTNNISDENKSQIYSVIFFMFEKKSIYIKDLIGLVDDKSLEEYYIQHKDGFKSHEIVELYKNGKVNTISNKELEIIFNDGSYSLLCEVVEKFNLDKSIVEKRKKVDNEKAIIWNKKKFLTRLGYNSELNEYGQLKLSEDEKQTLVENGSATMFYDLWNKGLISNEIYEKRNALDRGILEHANEYDESTVMEAFSGLYFHNSSCNFKYDLETILDYCESDSKFKVDNIGLLRKLHDFLTGEYVCNRPEDFKKIIDELGTQCQNFQYAEFSSTFEGAKDFFSKQLNSNLKSTMKTMISNITPEPIEGTDVKMYKIANQTEAQKNILMLIHTESVERAKNYYGQNANAMCFSVNDKAHLSGFCGDNSITFGYLGVQGNQMISAYTGDGQTNQMSGIFDGTSKGVMPPDLYSIDDYMQNTTGSYNEVLYKINGKKIKPDYIITYSEKPTDEEIEIAEEHHIPILFVDRSRYINRQQQAEVPANHKNTRLYDVGGYREIKHNTRVTMKEYRDAILPHLKDVEKLQYIDNMIEQIGKDEQRHEL